MKDQISWFRKSFSCFRTSFPWPSLGKIFSLSLCPETIMELLSLCPKKLHCPVPLEMLIDITQLIDYHMISSRFFNRLSNLELVTLIWFWSTWWNVVSVGWLLRFGRCMLPAVRTLLSSYNYTLTPPATARMRRRRLRRNTAAAPLYSTTISLQQPVVAFHVNQGWYNQKEKEKKNISRSLAS